MNSDLSISHKVKELLTLRGLTAYQLSQQTGLSRDYISKLLSSQISNPGLDKIQKIATVLNVELETFGLEPAVSVGSPAPILVCIGRQPELAQLEQWVLQDSTKIVWIWGLAGIGKSTLAAALAQSVSNSFEQVIWHDLAYASSSTPPWMSSITNGSRNLVLVDRAEMVWQQPHVNSLTSQDSTPLESWVHQLQTLPNRSCLVGISREKPSWIRRSENVCKTVRSLKLNGLGIDSRCILEQKGLHPCPQWDDLISLYRGHPLALSLAAIAIQDVFGGSVTEFLKQNTLFLGDLSPLFKAQIDRIFPQERQILYALASAKETLDFEAVHQLFCSTLRRSQIIDAINQLIGRSLIETSRICGEIKYGLQPLIRQYISSEIAASLPSSQNYA
jgi:transcriptional regulator with XRE-family HTH domain